MRGAAGWRNGSRNTAIREIPKLIQSTGSNAFRSRKRAIMLNGYSKICKFIGRDSRRGSERKPSGLQRCRPTKALIEDHSFHSRIRRPRAEQEPEAGLDVEVGA